MRNLNDRYASATFFQPEHVVKHIHQWCVLPQWVNDCCFWYRSSTPDGELYVYVDPRIPERRVASEAEFTAATGAASQSELVSPDGKSAMYVQGHNLWLHDRISGERRALTSDGVEHFAYGIEQGGTMTSLSDALAGKQLPPAAMWSPDSRYLLTIRVDERAVQDMHLLQVVPDEGLRPRLHTYKLAMAADEHLPILSYWLVDTHNGRVYPTQVPTQTGTGESVFYWSQFGMTIARLWRGDSRVIHLHTQSADQRRIDLYEVDAQSGAAHLVLTESAETPVYLNAFRFNNPNYRVLDSSGDLIWYSEKSGWGQLYLHDLATGALKHRITGGTGVVRDVLHVDEVERWVYFTAGGIEADRNPYYRHLYRARLDGSAQELLTPEDAEHLIAMSPDGSYVVDSYGTLDSPLRTVVRDVRGSVILPLETSDDAELRARGWRPPEAFCAKGRDGKTDIYGVLYRPTHFDPDVRYPVIDMIYGGSQLTVTPRLFPLVTGSPYSEFNLEILLEDFWAPQALSELGFIVVVMDGMGTPYRDRWFHEAALREPGNAGGAEDHVCAIRQLAAERPYMNVSRVGICGHSAGGDNSLKAMLRFPDFFKVGVSSAGSHNIAAYQAGAGLSDMGPDIADFAAMTNEALAHNLQGKLLLIYGDMDENCHPLHTLRVVEALIKADKDFDLLVMPNRNHSFTTAPYFVRRRAEYFLQHL
ncbi:MAG: DPP IV N-terminal domain-containing protein [bacterium]|nr:DPP IV N-terminal domain-containing protein [bacterium]